MPLSKERIRFIAVYGAIVILLAAAAIIIIEHPEVLSPAEQPALQIVLRKCDEGRNDSGTNNVNASFTIVVKNSGTSNESKMLVCSVTFQNGSAGFVTFDNRTFVTLTPGETRTYKPVVYLPDNAKSKVWTLSTVFE
jgi:hypothetical protein